MGQCLRARRLYPGQLAPSARPPPHRGIWVSPLRAPGGSAARARVTLHPGRWLELRAPNPQRSWVGREAR
eukprot:7025594-Pyramimonas_sp.AAC.1